MVVFGISFWARENKLHHINSVKISSKIGRKRFCLKSIQFVKNAFQNSSFVHIVRIN